MKPRAMVASWVVMVALALGTGACASRSALRIEPVQEAAAIQPRFDQSYYRADRDGTLFFVLRSTSKDSATGEDIEQIVTVRMFWQPVGGRTSLNPLSLNATFRYVLLRPDAVGMYEGAGFVRLSGKVGAPHLTARVMDADLRLTQASAKFKDTLGRSHLRGRITARHSDFQAMDQILQAHREFFIHSLDLAQRRAATSAPAPDATTPGAKPDTPATAPRPGQ